MYNTDRKPLIIREYGRNAQRLVDYAKTIQDPVHRQAFVERIIELIMEMYPHTRNVEDYRLKIWSHVLMMSNYELDVEVPQDIPSARYRRHPEAVPYPKRNWRFRHYGSNVQDLIDKALHMEDSPKRQEFLGIIGSYMKMTQKAANRDHINDEQIREDFERMTEGRLSIPEQFYLDGLINPRPRRQNNNTNKRNNNSGGKYSRKRK
ncbi:MAG: DUF4290 domain-containing protein [Saprospiraceae bacterium]|nr:DUF4290 domain-containing protein [Saprospiraceae bacterium]